MRKILFAPVLIFVLSLVAFGQVQQELSCPFIHITGPSFLPEPNETVTFSVAVLEDSKDPLKLYKGEKKLEYIWTVEDGKIIEGQGTSLITVEVNEHINAMATVEIKGLPKNCPNTAAEVIMGHPPPKIILIDEFLTSETDEAKLDKFADALLKDSSTTGYVINYNDKKFAPEKLKQKQEQIRKYLAQKNIPADRIIIINGGDEEDLTKLFLVPAGAEPPTP